MISFTLLLLRAICSTMNNGGSGGRMTWARPYKFYRIFKEFAEN